MRHSRSRLASALVGPALGLALSASPPATARADGDPGRGLALASQWCNSCHVIQPSDASWDDGEIGPPFSTQTRQTPESLKRLFAPGHADMDTLSKLTDRDVTDLAAHLHRLKPEPRSR